MNTRRTLLVAALLVLHAAALSQVPYNSPADPVRAPRPVELKSPFLAFGLSFLLPGAGQYYNGHYLKGGIQTATFAAGIVMMLTMGTETYYSSGAYTDYSYYGTFTYYRPSTEEETSAWFYVGIGVAGASWLWSVIDAPLSAGAINDRRLARRTYGHAIEFETETWVLGIDAGPTRRGVGMQVALHF